MYDRLQCFLLVVVFSIRYFHSFFLFPSLLYSPSQSNSSSIGCSLQFFIVFSTVSIIHRFTTTNKTFRITSFHFIPLIFHFIYNSRASTFSPSNLLKVHVSARYNHAVSTKHFTTLSLRFLFVDSHNTILFLSNAS